MVENRQLVGLTMWCLTRGAALHVASVVAAPVDSCAAGSATHLGLGSVSVHSANCPSSTGMSSAT